MSTSTNVSHIYGYKIQKQNVKNYDKTEKTRNCSHPEALNGAYCSICGYPTYVAKTTNKLFQLQEDFENYPNENPLNVAVVYDYDYRDESDIIIGIRCTLGKSSNHIKDFTEKAAELKLFLKTRGLEFTEEPSNFITIQCN